MKAFYRFARTFFVASVAFSSLVACGGGGGGGNNGFTGVSTLAVIDDTNAQQLVTDAYAGGSLTDPLVIPLAVGGSQKLDLAPLGGVLFNSLPDLDFAPSVKPLAVETLPGTCGGSATANISEGSTSASGSIVYENYCDAGVTLNGSVTFSASLNITTNVVSMSMSFNSLTAGGESLSGTVSMSFDLDDPNAATTMGMNIVLTDSFGQTYWVDHYSIVITPGVSFDTAVVSGTYHDFDAGHVAITTIDPLQVDNFTGTPESGTLHFTGASGTYADLVATGGGGYTLTVSTGTVITGSF
ncbi:MAG TPA: hypothetical protein VJ995_00440 [Geothermobacteraceae bacterium]|nr:hypothetical protein [Geothermobacteraceae bacterium]